MTSSIDRWAVRPLLWTPAGRTAYQDALNRIIRSGANPESELRTVVRKVSAELDRVKSGIG